MERNFKLYLKLFTSTFTISAFTFGGGYVIVPMMRKRFVDELGWIKEEEILDMLAISQSAPGPIAINTSILIGYRIAGILGAAVTILGTVLPPLIILSVVSLFYEAFSTNRYVAALLKGMRSGVSAVIAAVVIDMAAVYFKKKDFFSISVMLLSFAVSFFFNVNVIYIILSCAVVGIAAWLIGRKKENTNSSVKKEDAK